MSRAFDLIAPNIPAFGRLTGKKLHAGKVSHEPNNAFPRLIRLFGMLFDVAEDDLTHTGVNSLRVSLRGKDAVVPQSKSRNSVSALPIQCPFD